MKILNSPGIGASADGFAAELKILKIPFCEMKPGETILYRGRQLMKINEKREH